MDFERVYTQDAEYMYSIQFTAVIILNPCFSPRMMVTFLTVYVIQSQKFWTPYDPAMAYVCTLYWKHPNTSGVLRHHSGDNNGN